MSAGALTAPPPAVAELAATPSWSVIGDQAGGRLGAGVAGAGDVNGDGFDDVVAGAPRQDVIDTEEAGLAFLWLGAPDGPASTPAWSFKGDRPFLRLGASVSGAGDVDGDGFDDVLVGAPGWSEGEEGEGRVLLFSGSPTGLSGAPSWSFEADLAAAGLFVVAAAGDVNGDGFDDVILGAPGDGREDEPSGRAHVFHGSPSGLSAEPDWTRLSDGIVGDRFGFAVAGIGDVNGDGFDDVAVGAPGQPGAMRGTFGQVHVYLGSAEGLDGESAELLAPGSFTAIGTSLAGAGDVDGDGHDDLITGGPVSCATESAPCGSAHVYRGTETGVEAMPAWSWISAFDGDEDAVTDSTGQWVAGLGDVDGDGLDDVAVGAPTASDSMTPLDLRGQARVFLGDAAGLPPDPDWAAFGDQPGVPPDLLGGGDWADFGQVARAGDVDGDGSPDLLVAAARRDAAAEDEGALFLYLSENECPEPSALDLRPFVQPLTVARAGDELRLSWQDLGPDGHALHEGLVADLRGTTEPERTCLGPAPLASLPLAAGSRYFLVTATCGGTESPSGRDSLGAARRRAPGGCP